MNSEEPINAHQHFDRIICNCALMITADAVKMLANLHAHAVPGCLFGLSVWGSKAENTLMSGIRESIEESGF